MFDSWTMKNGNGLPRRAERATLMALKRRQRRRQPGFEDLGRRIALAANLSLVGQAYLVDQEDNRLDMAAVPEGCPIFIHKEWTATDLPPSGRDGTGAYVVKNEIDGVGLWHPGGWPWGVGVPGTSQWFEYWGGWQTTPGVHKASVMLDGFDNFAETDETYDNSYDFTFTTVAKPVVTIRATKAVAMEAGTEAGLHPHVPGEQCVQDDRPSHSLGDGHAGGRLHRVPESVVMPAGVSSITFGVFPVDDTETEPRETVVVNVTPDDCYAVGPEGEATVGIKDNDTVVTIAATKVVAMEAGTETGIFTVTRQGDTTDLLVVDYTVGGTATAGADYAPLSGHVTIPAGQASTTLGVFPVDDAETEPRETVVVTLSDNVTGSDTSYRAGNPASATVEIRDNDTMVKVEATKPDASEIGPVAGEFTTTRRGDIKDSLDVDFVVSGTATSGLDYAPLPTRVTIPAGAHRSRSRSTRSPMRSPRRPNRSS